MPKYFLMYNDATSATGRELGEWLKEHGLDVAWGKSTGDVRYDGLVRWGSTAKVEKKPGKVINWQGAIHLASQKLDSLALLRDNGVWVPEIYTENSLDIQFPVMGRTLQHVGGTDIVLCMQAKDIPIAVARGCRYFTRYLPVDVEYRIHVFNGKIIKISEKALTDPEKWQPHIRNLSTGYTFRVPDPRPSWSVRAIAVEAVELHNLHFAAADVVVSNGRPYVLELNTAPGLKTDSSLEAYGTCILEEFA